MNIEAASTTPASTTPPPSTLQIGNAILCNMRHEHPYSSCCGYCVAAITYVDEVGIYGVGMLEYKNYLSCPRCKAATPIPCEDHADTAAKLGRLTDQQLKTVFKIHAIFCFNENCNRVLCRYYKAKMAERFGNDRNQPLRPIMEYLESLKR